ncbi:MAG: NTPase [Chloroflexota bacterium]
MPRVYLLTGKPGTGKTSLIKQVAADLKGRAGGFYTEEIRSQGSRLGFRLVTLDGQEAILAHVDIRSPYGVSKYGVDIAAIDRVGVAALRHAAGQSELIIIDEIGKMEFFSDNFRAAVREIINGGKKILGTIMLASHPWADEIKRHPQVKLVTVTRDNHQRVLEDIRSWLK